MVVKSNSMLVYWATRLLIMTGVQCVRHWLKVQDRYEKKRVAWFHAEQFHCLEIIPEW